MKSASPAPVRLASRAAALLASVLLLSGCGTYMVASTVSGAGSAVVGGAVGAVRLTGRTAGAVVTAGRGNDEAEE
ncbi:hypothetical protein [Hoeflea sp.]|uniref:hypothetical protein n=1 Tax=Hoeflea sp. TaxID=1940281 RepID=UPI003B5218FA